MKLDKEQLKAITSEGSIAVIAGPGSGKTRVLLNKAQYESQKGNKTLCLTFTRSAAEEIRQRAPRVRASTIHSLCYQYLGRFPNIPQGHPTSSGDYDELLDEFLDLKIKPGFDLVLVDEFQDLTSKELKVVLSVCKNQIFLVGDNNQAIFGYCDAMGFEIPKTKIKKIYLHRNYRSGSSVLEKLERLNLRNLVAVNSNGNSRIKGTVILFRTNHHLDLVAYTLKNLDYSFIVRKRGLKYPGQVISNTNGNPGNLILSTIHCAKGKEWKKVICFDWGERLQEKNLIYVATARASQEFHLIDSLSELTNLIGKPNAS